MNIREIRRIRPYLTDYVVRTLVQTTVTVRLDYCNSLYNGLTVGTMKKLQIAQNMNIPQEYCESCTGSQQPRDANISC